MKHETLRTAEFTESPWVQNTRRALVTILFVTGALLSLTAIVNAEDAPHGALRPVLEESEDTPAAKDASVTDEQIEQWIDQLGDESYAVREHAAERLVASGQQAVDALRKGSGSDVPETAWRCQKLLDRILADESPELGESPFENSPFRDSSFRDSPFRGRLRARMLGPDGWNQDTKIRDLNIRDLDTRELEEWVQQLLDDSLESLRITRMPRMPEPRMPEMETFLEGFDFEALDRQFEQMLGGDLGEFAKRLGENFERHGSHHFHTEMWENGKKVFERSFSSDEPEGGRNFAVGGNVRLGVQVEPVGPALRAHLELAEGEGLVVEQVLDGSVAAAAGLEPHDVITTVGDRTIGSVAALREAVADERTIELSIIRKGKKSKVTLNFPSPQPEEGVRPKKFK